MPEAATIDAPASPYLTKAQARRYLGGDRMDGVSERWLERQRIRHVRVCGLVRYLRDDLDTFMARHAIDVPGKLPKGRTRAVPAPRRSDAAAAPGGWLDGFGKAARN